MWAEVAKRHFRGSVALSLTNIIVQKLLVFLVHVWLLVCPKCAAAVR